MDTNCHSGDPDRSRRRLQNQRKKDPGQARTTNSSMISPMDLRQSKEWGDYLSKLNWKIIKVGKTQIFIRSLPLTGRSVIKIQHPNNPLPFEKIDEISKTYKALFTLIEPVSEKYNEGDFVKQNFQKSKMSLTHTASIFIDLKQKNLFSTFSENARRNIKKAQANNLTVKEVSLKNATEEDHRLFFKLLTNLTKLKKFYVPGYSEFLKKTEGMKDNSSFFFAYHKNQPVAAVWYVHFKDSGLYLQTGITKEGYKLLANYLLVWEVLQCAQKMKLKYFDFEGIYDPRFPKHRKSWQKFSEFKKRFHGDIALYPPPWIKYYSKIYKLFYKWGNLF